MQFQVKSADPAGQKTACAILPVFADGEMSSAGRQIDRSAGGAIAKLVKSGDVSGRQGKSFYLPNLAGGDIRNVLLVGCGEKSDFSAKRLASACGSAARVLRDLSVREAISYLVSDDHAADIGAYYSARIQVEAYRSAFYRFDELKSRSTDKPRLNRICIGIGDASHAKRARGGLRDGVAIANGMDLARDLGNRPPNVCTPTHLADVARQIAKDHAKIDIKVLGEREIKRLGMGALLAVTQGSEAAVRFIVMHYRGAAAKSAPIAICGKGVTFDTGGISLKPPPKMDEMKFDMCGAAGVLGAMRTLAELQPKINVTALIPACENMPSGRATRPGDIVKSLSGKTIEILNTDAEGRLILCDALTYAKRFKPRYLLDVATLTGACVVALGPLYTGLFSNNDKLAEEIREAGRRSLDPAWHMPVDQEYGESLRSQFADFANAGSRNGGASVAAQFLSRFADGVPWAHLDIAGVAWHSNANKGATGRPVPLLIDFLLNA